MKIPDGYTLEFGGQFKNLQEARLRLLLVVPAALILIYLIVFRGVRQACAKPSSSTPESRSRSRGGVFALWLRSMPFSITAAVGFIALKRASPC